MLPRDPVVCLEGPGPYAPHAINIGTREERKKPHVIIRNRDYRWGVVGINGLSNDLWQRKFERLERGELPSNDAWFRRMCCEYC